MHYFTSISITGEVALNVFAFKGILGCRTSLQFENYILPKIIIVPVESDKPVKGWRGREYKVQSTWEFSITASVPGERRTLLERGRKSRAGAEERKFQLCCLCSRICAALALICHQHHPALFSHHNLLQNETVMCRFSFSTASSF